MLSITLEVWCDECDKQIFGYSSTNKTIKEAQAELNEKYIGLCVDGKHYCNRLCYETAKEKELRREYIDTDFDDRQIIF